MKHKDIAIAVMHGRAAKFTADVRAGKYKIPPVENHAGNQARLFADYDLVQYRPGTGREGTTFEIIEGRQLNGYWNYTIREAEVRGPEHFVQQDNLERNRS